MERNKRSSETHHIHIAKKQLDIPQSDAYSVNFVKMEGLGNDFVIIDGRSPDFGQLSRKQICWISNRNVGVGCDTLIVLKAVTSKDAIVKIDIYNCDGMLVEACGNATRCV